MAHPSSPSPLAYPAGSPTVAQTSWPRKHPRLAFRLGAQYGYRMFECDAKLSADGVPFLMHDATLERTTSSHGTGGDLPRAELAQLDAGLAFPQPRGRAAVHAGEPGALLHRQRFS